MSVCRAALNFSSLALRLRSYVFFFRVDATYRLYRSSFFFFFRRAQKPLLDVFLQDDRFWINAFGHALHSIVVLWSLGKKLLDLIRFLLLVPPSPWWNAEYQIDILFIILSFERDGGGGDICVLSNHFFSPVRRSRVVIIRRSDSLRVTRAG